MKALVKAGHHSAFSEPPLYERGTMYTPAITDIAPASSIGANEVVYIIVTNITVATQKAINLEL